MATNHVNLPDTKPQIASAYELVHQRRFAEAIAICRELLLTLNGSEIAEAHEIIGCALAESGQLAQGIDELTVALEHDSLNTMIRLNLAACLARAGRHAEAVEHLQYACAHDPTDLEIRLRLFGELLYLRQYGEAHDELRIVLSSRTHPSVPRSALYVLLAMCVWGKWGYGKRLIVIAVIMVGLFLPVTRLVLWIVISLVTVACLIILARGHLLNMARPIVTIYIALTLACGLVVALWR